MPHFGRLWQTIYCKTCSKFVGRSVRTSRTVIIIVHRINQSVILLLAGNCKTGPQTNALYNTVYFDIVIPLQPTLQTSKQWRCLCSLYAWWMMYSTGSEFVQTSTVISMEFRNFLGGAFWTRVREMCEMNENVFTHYEGMASACLRKWGWRPQFH